MLTNGQPLIIQVCSVQLTVLAMAPKQSPDYAPSDEQSPTHRVETEQPQQTDDQDIINQLVLSEQLLQDISASSDDTLEALTERFHQMHLEFAEKSKMVKQVLSDRKTITKKEETKRRTRERRALKSATDAAARGQMLTIRVRFRNLTFMVEIAAGEPVGQLRRAIMQQVNRFIAMGSKKFRKDACLKLSLSCGDKVDFHQRNRVELKNSGVDFGNVVDASLPDEMLQGITFMHNQNEEEESEEEDSDDDEVEP